MAKKIDQLVEEIGSLTAMELVDFSKALEEKFGVSPMVAAPGAAAPVAGGAEKAEAAEEKASYKLELVAAGSSKIETIKALRKVNKDLGLTEAKKLAEETPSVLFESVPKADAENAKKVLEGAGAQVKLS